MKHLLQSNLLLPTAQRVSSFPEQSTDGNRNIDPHVESYDNFGSDAAVDVYNIGANEDVSMESSADFSGID